MPVKDTAFTYMFGMEEHLVDLYDVVSGIRFKPSDIKTVKLEDRLGKRRLYNDVAFLTPDNRLLILIEHQSTLNPNMIFRLLEYYIALVSAYIRKTNQNRYGTKLLEFPKAELYVVYNGKGKMTELPVLDLGYIQAKVKVVNIHFESLPNKEDKSNAVTAYSLYVDLVASGLRPADAALELAEQGYLPEFFGRKEHRDMFAELFSYDNELRAEGEAEGIAKGIEQGITQGEYQKAVNSAITMKSDGMPLGLIAKYTGLSEEEIKLL